MDFPIVLDPNDKAPPYRRLAKSIKGAIESGRLAPGAALPSTAELAEELGMARSTIIRCYAELTTQNYIRSVKGVGSFVNELVSNSVQPSGGANQNATSVHLSSFAQRLVKESATPTTQGDNPALNFGAPPLDLLPTRTWRQLLLKYCRTDESTSNYSRESLGYRPLREAIASYLKRSRAVKCEVEQIAVYPSALRPLQLIAEVLTDAGDSVACESPSFPWLRRMFANRGVQVQGIPVDDFGMNVDYLKRSAMHHRLAQVTPSHQDPTGAVMSLERRIALLEWAQNFGAIIVEDDYDSEFRYRSQSMPSLQGIDTYGRVIYYSSFWKILAPLVSCCYLVLPEPLVEVFSRVESQYDSNIPLLEQYALTDFINEGHLETQIKRYRQIYSSRLQAMISALTRQFDDQLVLPKETAGTQMLIRFDSKHSDVEILKLAEEAGLMMSDASPYFFDDKPKGTFMLSFSHSSEDLIGKAVERFGQSMR